MVVLMRCGWMTVLSVVFVVGWRLRVLLSVITLVGGGEGVHISGEIFRWICTRGELPTVS